MPILDIGIDSSDALKGAQDYDNAAKKIETSTDQIVGKTQEGTKSFIGLKDGMMIAFGEAVLASITTAATLVAGFAQSAIKAASDFEETENKFNVVFKGMEGDAKEFASTLEKSYAMSITESRKFLGSVQDLLVPMGMARGEAGKMSFEIVKLAADLGSFNNMPTADVMENITAALTGEYEGMKKYGIILNETTIAQEAANLGYGTAKDQLTAAEKAQAAYSLMVKNSADALGDMERSSGSYANQLKALNAGIESFTTMLGQQLLPFATRFITILSAWVNNQENVNRVLGATVTTAQFLYNGFKGIELVLHGVLVVAASVFDAVYQKIAMLLSPVSQLFDGLVKIGVMDNNPLQQMKRATEDFAASAVEGFQKVWKETEDMNNKFEASKTELTQVKTKTEELSRSQTQLAGAASLAAAGIATETEGLYGYMSAQQIAEAQTNGTTIAMGGFIDKTQAAAETTNSQLNPAIRENNALVDEMPSGIEAARSYYDRFSDTVDETTSSVTRLNSAMEKGSGSSFKSENREVGRQTNILSGKTDYEKWLYYNSFSNYLGNNLNAPASPGGGGAIFSGNKGAAAGSIFAKGGGTTINNKTININQSVSRSDVSNIMNESDRQTIRG